MAAGVGPLVESLFALDLFGRSGGDAFPRWRKQVRADLVDRVGDVETLTRNRPPLQEVLMPGQAVGEGGGNRLSATTRRQHDPSIIEFCQVAVMPYWSSARRHLESEREIRGRHLVVHGVERMLSTLHGRVHWHQPVLEINSEQELDIYLDGTGLTLSPAVFLNRQTCVLLENGPHATLCLAFATKFDESMLSQEFSDSPAPEASLGALIGHTRAAALQVLTESCSTSELAEQLGISMAGASKHATVLRAAGLIATTRLRNSALHTVTSLGMALLQNRMLESELTPDLCPPIAADLAPQPSRAAGYTIAPPVRAANVI